jgi:hypothetical protein
MSGGPIVRIAATTSTLPVLTGTSLTWSNNEVQTITKSGTVSGGTYTLEVVNPSTGASETTAAIAYDADATAIKAALAALGMFVASDLTVTGGPISSTPVVITIGGVWANTPFAAIEVDDDSITGGGGIPNAVRTTPGRLWTELPDVIKEANIKQNHKATPHQPAFSPHPTGSTTTDFGVEQIAFDIEEADLDAFNIGLASSLLVLTAAGAGQCAMQTLTQPLPADIDAGVYQLALNYIGPQGSSGWGIVEHYFKAKRNHAMDMKFGVGSVRMLRIVFDIFADSTQSYQCVKRYEYISAPTS